MSSEPSKTSWPPAEGLTSPIVPRQDVTFTTHASIHISAPAELVFNLVLDTSTYPTWCTFVPKVTITHQPSSTPPDSTVFALGTKFTYHVIMDSSKPHKETPTHLKITDISTPEKQSSYIPADTLEKDPSYEADLSKLYRVAWSGDSGFFARGLRSERFHEIVVLGEGECEVRTWETMGGVLASTVKWLYKDTLARKFGEWNEDLKKAAEQRYAAKGSASA